MATANDDALQTALAQFNEGLKTQAAEQRSQRAIGRADRAKQDAAAALKKLDSNPDASSDDKTTAAAAYRAAVDEWTRLRAGDTPTLEPEEAPSEESAPDDSPDATSEGEPADETGESLADDAPGDTADPLSAE